MFHFQKHWLFPFFPSMKIHVLPYFPMIFTDVLAFCSSCGQKFLESQPLFMVISEFCRAISVSTSVSSFRKFPWEIQTGRSMNSAEAGKIIERLSWLLGRVGLSVGLIQFCQCHLEDEWLCRFAQQNCSAKWWGHDQNWSNHSNFGFPKSTIPWDLQRCLTSRLAQCCGIFFHPERLSVHFTGPFQISTVLGISYP